MSRRTKLFVAFNVLLLTVNAATYRGFDRKCDYCHNRDHYRESLAEKVGRQRTSTPLLHMACLRYLCETKQLDDWRRRTGWDSPNFDYHALQHPETHSH